MDSLLEGGPMMDETATTTTLTWEEVDEFGVEVCLLRDGAQFVNVVADGSTLKFEEVVGRVIEHYRGSVLVEIVRSGRMERITWAPAAKVIPI